MGRAYRRRLKEKLAAVYQHFLKATLMSAELYPDLNRSDERLGEMIKDIGIAGIEGQEMVKALWKVMWGEPPEEIHPQNV